MKPLSLTKPHLIIMVGIPGSGKSFFAEHFADTFKAPIISFERLRKDLFKTPTFNKNEDDIITRVANNVLSEILKTERTIIYDGQTDSRGDRDLISKIAKSFNYEPLFVWVQTEPSTAKKRLIKISTEQPVISPEQFETKLKQFSAPSRNDNNIVISGKHTYASQLKIVLKHLVEPRKQIVEHQSLARPSGNRNILIN